MSQHNGGKISRSVLTRTASIPQDDYVHRVKGSRDGKDRFDSFEAQINPHRAITPSMGVAVLVKANRAGTKKFFTVKKP